MVGGLATSFLLELLVYPAIYLLWKQRTDLNRRQPRAEPLLASQAARVPTGGR
jgi:hypothetical protein